MKRILYVDKNPEDYISPDNYRRHTGREEHILEALKKNYNIDFVHGLHSKEVDIELEKNHFDLFLTHLPYHPKDFTYESSLERLKDLIKRNNQIKVVVYTGADTRTVSDKQLKEIGVLAIIRKKLDDKFTDALRLRRTLEKILR